MHRTREGAAMDDTRYMNQGWIDYSAPACNFRAERENQEEYFAIRYKKEMMHTTLGEPWYVEWTDEWCLGCHGTMFFNWITKRFYCACGD